VAYNRVIGLSLIKGKMAGAAHRLEGDHSRIQENERIIDCPVSVLHAIRAWVLERFNSAPHGGVEGAGVLFGTYRGEEVRIAAFRAVSDDSAFSHSPGLTEAERAIAGLISAARSGRELPGLEPVGWFRSHPRSDLKFSERDLEISNALFPQPWQVELVLRPGNSAPSRVRFFFRGEPGPWKAECPFREIALPAVNEQKLDPGAPPALDARSEDGAEDRSEDIDSGAEAVVPESAPLVDAPQPSDALPPPEIQPPAARPWTLLRWPLVVVAAVGLAGALYWVNRPQQLALRLSDSAGQLRITWDRTASSVRDSRAAHLEISDGGQKLWIELDPEQLHDGNVTYARHSNNVGVRLVVQAKGGAALEEAARFLGSGQAAMVASAQNQPQGETASRDRPSAATGAAGGPQSPPELVVSVPVEPVTPAAAPRKFVAPRASSAQAAIAGRTIASEMAPPPLVSRDTPPVGGTPSVMRMGSPTVKPAPPAASSTPSQSPVSPPPAPRVPAAPASGRVIWIGRLQKNQPVTISGKNSSTGTIIGELPARPFKFSVSPGDLSSDGIVLYTSNLQYANNVVEPAGAENGWNKTTYTWNPKYANDVTVDEPPAALKGWNRIILRSKNPRISVIVIDWTAVN
jgi:proteasome lid subunit RPN8/RPN11